MGWFHFGGVGVDVLWTKKGQKKTIGSAKKNEAQLDAQSPSSDRARAFPLIPRPSASQVASHIQLQSKSRSHGYRTTGAAIST